MLDYQEDEHFIQIKGNFNYQYLFILIKRNNEDELKSINGIAHLLEHYLISTEHDLLSNICSSGTTNYEKILLMYRFDNTEKLKNVMCLLKQTFSKQHIEKNVLKKVKNEVLFELNTIKQRKSFRQIKIITNNKYTVLPMGNKKNIKTVSENEMLSYIKSVNDFNYRYIYVAKEFLFNQFSESHNHVNIKNLSTIDLHKIHYFDNTLNITEIYFRTHFFIQSKYKTRINYDILYIIINHIFTNFDCSHNENNIVTMGKTYLDEQTTYLHLKAKFNKKEDIEKFTKDITDIVITENDFKKYKESLYKKCIEIPSERDLKKVINNIEDEFFWGIGKLICLKDLKEIKNELMKTDLEEFNFFLNNTIRNECFIFKQIGEKECIK